MKDSGILVNIKVEKDLVIGLGDCGKKAVDELNKRSNQLNLITITANKTFARYFLVLDNGKPIVTVMLQRDGHIIFFISKNVSSPIRLIRVLKQLADKQTDCLYPIITRTANWYKEANRINKLIGFSLWKESEKSSLWIYPPLHILQDRTRDKYGWKN